jgi:myo-inositol-1(or 4)-monophosphatase
MSIPNPRVVLALIGGPSYSIQSMMTGNLSGLLFDEDVPIAEYDAQTLLAHAVSLAAEAAELVVAQRITAVGQVTTKSTETDVVTAADRASEQLIRTRLADLWPDAHVLGEEEGGAEATDGLVWVVDPIDGTVNYLYGAPSYAVSVAAQVDGVSVAGAVVEPATGRTWTAARGQGAWLDGRPLAVSDAGRLELALVATGFAYDAGRRGRQARMWAELLPRVRDIRRGGSAALDLCAVAAGWVDAHVEHGLNRWDWAAAALIAQEAGAVLRLPYSAKEAADLAGLDDGLGADAVLAAAPGIAEALRGALVAAGAGEV